MKNKAKIKQRCVAEIRQALSRIRPDGGGFGGGGGGGGRRWRNRKKVGAIL